MRLVLQLVLLFNMVTAVADSTETCSIDQRIELARAGYDKTEVNELCAAGEQESSAQAQKTPDEVLAAAIYEGSETPPLNRMYSSREKCEFLGDSVKLNNNKKTFGGYYSKVIPYNKFSTYKSSRLLNVDRDRRIINAMLAITAFGIGAANETCIAVLIHRENVAPEDFDTLEAWAKGELDAVTQALNAKGANIEQ